jgi:hypothetical protein
MIRRDADSHFLLITQHDHALLAAQFARRLGNEHFAPPNPFPSTDEAIANHDSGWPLHDDHPTLNKNNQPLHVFEAPVSLATQVWSASVARAMNLGDYQGLLVSLHTFALSALHMAHAKDLSRPDMFEMNKFQHRQIEIQHDLRGRLGLSNEIPLHLGLAKRGQSPADDQLLHNFRLLTAMDRISLALCCGENLFPTLDDVPASAGQSPKPITLHMRNISTMVIDPWPFDEPNSEFKVPARRISKTPFDTLEAFRDAYRQASVEPLTLTLCGNS